jgi:hypothetical protein
VKVLSPSLRRMLSDPYYAGWVTVTARYSPDRHEAIVSQLLFGACVSAA